MTSSTNRSAIFRRQQQIFSADAAKLFAANGDDSFDLESELASHNFDFEANTLVEPKRSITSHSKKLPRPPTESTALLHRPPQQQLEHQDSVRGKWHRDRSESGVQRGGGSLWPPPRLLRKGGFNDYSYEHEREMTWSELFFDLIFVVAIARLGEQFRNGSIDGFVYALYFTLLWYLWLGAAVYATRFGSNDLPNMLFFGFYMGGIVIVSVNLSGGPSDHASYRGMCAGLAVSAFTTALIYFRIIIYPPPYDAAGNTDKTRGFAQLFFATALLKFCGFGALALGAAATWGVEVRMHALIGVLLCCELPYWLLVILRPCVYAPAPVDSPPRPWWDRDLLGFATTSRGGHLIKNMMLPVHLEHFTERIGLLVIIYLGEAVDDITTENHLCSVRFYAKLGLSFVIIFALKMLYFDTDADERGMHAMRRHRLTGVAWIHLHGALTAGIALTGSGLKELLAESPGGPSPGGPGAALLLRGVASTCFALSALAALHTRIWHLHGEPEASGASGGAGLGASDCHKAAYARTQRCIFGIQQLAMVAVGVVCAVASGNGRPDATMETNDIALLGALAGALVTLVLLNLLDEVLELRFNRQTR